MQPIIRLTNYIEEYKDLVYKYYSKVNNIVYATYYQLDHTETTYDPHYVATYHKTGEYSGRKYNKIHTTPLILIQQVLPILDGSERGVTYENTITAFSIDPSVGLAPHVGDIIEFKISEDYAIWEVTNIELSSTLEKPYYRCSVRLINRRSNFDDQIIHEYMYIEYAKKIYNLEDAINFIYLMSRHTQLVHFLNSKNCYNHNLAYHIYKNRCFPELETILSTLESLTPVGNIFMIHDYKTEVHPQSIFMLLCLPKLYDISKEPLLTYKYPNNKINKRLDVYIRYQEYITSDDIVLVPIPKENLQNQKLDGHVSPYIKYHLLYGAKRINSFGFHDRTFDLDTPLEETTEHIVYGELWADQLFDTTNIEFFTLLLYDYLKDPDTFMNTYTDPVDDSIIANLVDEWILYLHTNIEAYRYENKIATNLLEAVIEFSIVSNKLISLLHKDGVILS